MIHDVCRRLRDVLAAPPDPVLPAASIAAFWPGAAGDLPTLAVSVELERADQLGLGQLVRASEQLPDGSRVREDLRGLLLDGMVTFDAWAGQASAATKLSSDVEQKLAAGRAALRERGFIDIRPSALGAAEVVRQDAGVTAGFSAWRQRLACRFRLEWIEGGELTDGGRIDRVDVHLRGQAGESFSAP